MNKKRSDKRSNLLKKGFLVLLALIPVYFLGPRWDAVEAPAWFATEEGRPLIMAHGGAKELFPENTMVAFDGAASLGVDVLEMDVNLTADEVLVTIHGPDLASTTNGEGPVREATYEEIQALDAGYRFLGSGIEYPFRGQGLRHPALRDVLERFQVTPLLFCIELKDGGERGIMAAEMLARMLHDLGLEKRVMVASFADETIEAFRAAAGGRVTTSGSEEEVRRILIPSLFGLDKWWLFPGPVSALQIPVEGAGFDLTQKKVINHAHQHRQAVHYWTIDDPQMMRVLTERGADGLITDRPDLAREIFREMGFTLPEAVDVSSLDP
ncbi:MAG: glycerophosphodiester phosphodiesterase [Chloroflexota bacterium]